MLWGLRLRISGFRVEGFPRVLGSRFPPGLKQNCLCGVYFRNIEDQQIIHEFISGRQEVVSLTKLRSSAYSTLRLRHGTLHGRPSRSIAAIRCSRVAFFSKNVPPWALSPRTLLGDPRGKGSPLAKDAQVAVKDPQPFSWQSVRSWLWPAARTTRGLGLLRPRDTVT